MPHADDEPNALGEIDFLRIMRSSRFTDVKRLGEGGFGVVYKGKHADGQLRVVKFTPNAHEELLEEGKKMTKLRHPSLIQMFKVWRTPDPDSAYVEMEFCGGGDVHSRIYGGPTLAAELILWPACI